jgi:hypothetical protein
MVGTLNSLSSVWHFQCQGIDFRRLMAAGLPRWHRGGKPSQRHRDLLAEVTTSLAATSNPPSTTRAMPVFFDTLHHLRHRLHHQIPSMDRFAHFAFQYAEHALIVELAEIGGRLRRRYRSEPPDAMSRLPM